MTKSSKFHGPVAVHVSAKLSRMRKAPRALSGRMVREVKGVVGRTQATGLTPIDYVVLTYAVS